VFLSAPEGASFDDDDYTVVEILFADEKAFLAWANDLDLAAQIALRATLTLVGETHNTRLLPGKLVKQLHSGVCELRIGKTLKEALSTVSAQKPESLSALSERVLLRVFFAEISNESLVVLWGYDKGADRSPAKQQVEIGKSIEIHRAWLLQNDVF
jgi:hypothetical protein